MRDDETYEIPVVTAIAARINFTRDSVSRGGDIWDTGVSVCWHRKAPQSAHINFTGSEREFFYGGRNNCDTINDDNKKQHLTENRENLYIPRVFNAPVVPYGGVEYTWDI